jgi:glutamine synthetase
LAQVKIDELRAAGVKFVQTEFADINGYIRGKICNLEKGIAASGGGVSSLMEAVISGDAIVMTPFSNAENSFPKMVAVPDPATAMQWSWDPTMASVRCDLFMEDGTPTPVDPRNILKTVVARYDALGLKTKAALEYEFYLFEQDDALQRADKYHDLKPFGRSWDFYSVSRQPHFGGFAKDFLTRTDSVGIEVEMFHTEYGFGMYEYAHGPTDALKAADDAARGRLYLKQLAGEHGLVASFMPSIGAGNGSSNSGAHHNISLWRDGVNLMWDPATKGISETGRRFAAGILATMPDLHLLFRPWINSYRRMDRNAWNPENASWGLDSHTAAVRVVHGGVPPKHSRLEHRVSGADVNPYLGMAAILLGGLHGIENGLEPPPYVEGDAVTNNGGPMLPNSLEASILLFEQSPIARTLFGDQFVDHFATVKRAELDAFNEWKASDEGAATPDDAVGAWELAHYFEWA